jgi:MFS family permease
MYRFDWLERLKLNRAERNTPTVLAMSPVIWGLGFTSLLTDVSSEMVSSVLPAYLFLHLKLGPLQYGIVDGLYNGFAVALVSLAAGFLADRQRRHKLVAFSGYLLSALCKPALLLAGGAWTWILLIIGLDRIGKGIRSAPRDAILSLNAPPGRLASAFALHRALDACGALLGPIVALAILAVLPGGFDVVWIVSLGFAVLGLGTLALFVPQPELSTEAPTAAPPRSGSPASAPKGSDAATAGRRFRTLATCAFVLAVLTVSDGFIFIHLQRATSLGAGAFPLYYVALAGVYMVSSIPAGLLADRVGRPAVLIMGYALLAATYVLLLFAPLERVLAQVAVVVLLGLYYACTEGVLMAMGSALLPAVRRTTGLAILASVIGLGKAGSSVGFGWLMQVQGSTVALLTFLAFLPAVILIVARVLWGDR